MGDSPVPPVRQFPPNRPRRRNFSGSAASNVGDNASDVSAGVSERSSWSSPTWSGTVSRPNMGVKPRRQLS